MVVALVLLEFEGFDNESKVVVYLLKLLAVELLRLDQFLVNGTFTCLDSSPQILQLR